jgi:hypothetical protein
VLLLGLLAVARGVGGRAAASAVFGVGLLAWIAGAAARAAVASAGPGLLYAHLGGQPALNAYSGIF